MGVIDFVTSVCFASVSILVFTRVDRAVDRADDVVRGKSTQGQGCLSASRPKDLVS